MGNKAKREAFVSQRVAEGMSKTQAKKAYSGNKAPSKPKSLSKHRDSEHDGINVDRSWNSPYQDYAHTSEDI